MEIINSLRYMCRICATNLKKRSCNSQSVTLFTPTSIPVIEKLQRYLYINVKCGDGLPESICGSCMQNLESFHKFAKLAQKSETFLKELIFTIRKNSNPDDVIKRHFQEQVVTSSQEANDDVILISDNTESSSIYPKNKNPSNDMVLNFTPNNSVTKDMQSKIGKPKGYSEIRVVDTNKLREPKIQKVGTFKQILPKPKDQSELSEKRNNLEQKRRNLTMVLVNKNNNWNSMGPQDGLVKNAITEQVSMSSSPDYSSSNRNSIEQVKRNNLTAAQATIANLEQNLRNESVIYDCLNLGCVIKDMDLLKLILKALKWPFTEATLPETIQRLKNTRFRDVILDNNLLQDTDLTQILSHYLSPLFLQSQNMSTMLPTVVSYKIPADTSVHLVSVPSEDEGSSTSKVHPTTSQPKPTQIPPLRPLNNTPPTLIVSQAKAEKFKALQSDSAKTTAIPVTSLDMSNLRKLKRLKEREQRHNKLQIFRTTSPIEIHSDDSREIQNFEVSIDPALYFPQDADYQGDNSNESLVVSLAQPKSNVNKSIINIGEAQTHPHSKQMANITMIRDPNQGNTIKVRKKQKRKQIHTENVNKPMTIKKDLYSRTIVKTKVKIQTKRDDPKVINIITDKDGRRKKMSENLDKLVPPPQPSSQQNETIIIADDDVEDNAAVWADFKVIDSPDRINNDEQTPTIQQTSRTKQVTTSSASKVDTLKQVADNPKPTVSEKPTRRTQSVKKEQPTESVAVASVKQEVKEIRKRGRKKKESPVTDTAAVKPAKILKMEEPSTPSVVPLRQSKRRSATNYNLSKEIISLELSTTPTKTLTRDRKSKTTSRYYVSRETTKKEKASKPRKRICKQCGASYTSLLKFMTHRKKHK